MTSDLRARLKAKLIARSTSTEVHPPPRYDEVFRRGVEWLDSLAEDECVVIEGGAGRKETFERLGDGLELTFEVDGKDLVVRGDTWTFMQRIDSNPQAPQNKTPAEA